MPLDLPRFGVRLSQALEPATFAGSLAAAAEANGFASLWFAENPFHRGIVAVAGACAATTERIGIGLGIVNFYQHHPTLIAAEFAALDELAGGRVRLGIGSGDRAAGSAARLQVAPAPLAGGCGGDHPAAVARRRGGPSGSVFSAEGVRLGFRPPRPDAPIYVASMGDRSLALCGRIADGLIVSNMCPPRYTERAVGIVQQSAADAGRKPLDIVQYLPCVVRQDRDEARRLAKHAVGGMLTTFWPTGGDWPALRDTIVEQRHCEAGGHRRAGSAAAWRPTTAGAQGALRHL